LFSKTKTALKNQNRFEHKNLMLRLLNTNFARPSSLLSLKKRPQRVTTPLRSQKRLLSYDFQRERQKQQQISDRF